MQSPRATSGVPPRTSLASGAVTVALVSAVAAYFWVPALPLARGWFPAPLDDVYIHFDFARSLARGHPFEWIAGQGYSSGETSPFYAVVLAVGWAVGFRHAALGLWSALVAIASTAWLCGSIQRLLRPCPQWLAVVLAALPLAFGTIDWALFSGMEVALTCAVLARTLVALDGLDSPRRGGPTREAQQWRLGSWGALLVLLRPESVVVVAALAVAAGRAAGGRSSVAAAARVALPGAITTGALALQNLVLTGDARAAGAQLKLLSSNPYLSEIDRARVFVENLVTFGVKVGVVDLTVMPAIWLVVLVLVVAALVAPARRAVASVCVVSALGWTLLVSWNGNAPFHNFRYYVPALVLLVVAAAIGAAAIARRGRLGRGVALVLVGGLGAATIPRVTDQAVHFRGAVSNIRDQHVEAGLRIAKLPPQTRVLLGDAGAIPYVSDRPAIDALGLGGYRKLPFAHAAVFGEASTLELIERLPPSRRPTHLALYPNWFAAITSTFGREIDRVTIEKNVICGGPAKVLYVADWSALDVPHPEGPDVLDALDVADVVDEEAHAYAPPIPRGGFTSFEIASDERGARRFDAGRFIPEGTIEAFVVHPRAVATRMRLRLRIDDGAIAISATTRHGTHPLMLDPPKSGAWRSATVDLPGLADGDVVILAPHKAPLRDFHVWLERVE